MKNFILFILFIMPICIMAQIDSLDSQLNSKKREFVAGRVIKNSILSVPGDFSEMGHTITSDWKRTAIYAGSILGLVATDKITTGFWHDHVETTIDYRLPKIDVIRPADNFVIYGENTYILYPIVGLYTGSLLLNHEKGQVVALNAVKSITYSYVISHLFLKTVTARNRPHRKINDDFPAEEHFTKDNWDFGNFDGIHFKAGGGGGSGFPSFHATFYFSVAKVFQMEYNNYWIPYTVVTGVFLSNIKEHEHWVSDLLVGGLVGTIIGKSVVNSSRRQMSKNNKTAFNYNPKKFKMTKQLIPQISSSMVGFHFSGTF